jgi:hypothetical protein
VPVVPGRSYENERCISLATGYEEGLSIFSRDTNFLSFEERIEVR